jgi:MFS family permease
MGERGSPRLRRWGADSVVCFRTSRILTTMPLLVVALILYALMLPVTGMVPVLEGLTLGRFPGLSSFEQHLFMSANMVGAVVFAPLAGLLSDRLRRRRALILVALAVNAVTLHALTLEWSYPAYLAWRFVEGCAHISALSLLMTLGVDHARQQGLGGAMGIMGAAISLGVATGAPLGGLLGEDRPVAVLEHGRVLMIMLTLVAAAALRDPQHLSRREYEPGLVRSLLDNQRLAVPYLFAFVDRLTVGFIVSTMSLYFSLRLGMGAGRIGLAMAAFLVPFALLIYPAGLLCRRFDAVAMMLAGSFLYGVVLMLIGQVPVGAVTWLMLAGGVVAALMYTPSLVLTARYAEERHKASAISGFHFAGSIGFAVGPLLGGSLVTLFALTPLDPYRVAFVVVGGLEVLCVLAFLVLLRQVRRQRASRLA